MKHEIVDPLEEEMIAQMALELNEISILIEQWS